MSMLQPDPSSADAQDHALRPQRLSEFTGQEQITRNLSVFVQAARARGDVLDHVFLSGPPGLGKTTLAAILAREMGSPFRVTAAPALEKPKDLAGILTSLEEGAVFFIDEVHRLKPALEEMLYVAMEDFELDWVIGQGPSARSIRVPLPQFTLVGATTKPGRVSGPLFSRFGISQRLDLYDDGALGAIIARSAGLLGVQLEQSALPLLARCARGTPRVANRILRRMRDFAEVEGDGRITPAVVESGLLRMEIDGMGLERHDRAILRTLIEKFDGGPVGGETLAIAVGESVDTLEDFYEPYLIRIGMLDRTPRGRQATRSAWIHIGLSPPAESRPAEDPDLFADKE